MFIVNYVFKDDSEIEVDGQNVKYWISSGLPDYEGSLEGWVQMFPLHLNELLAKGILRERN